MEICNKASLTVNNHESDDSEYEAFGFDKVEMVKFLYLVYHEKLLLHRANNSNMVRLEEDDRLRSNNGRKFEFAKAYVSKQNPHMNFATIRLWIKFCLQLET